MRTIVFVDDEPNVLNGYRRILGSLREDWDLHFFEGAELALDFLATHPADVVVTDVKMPGMDGLELLARLSGPEWGNLPVIIVTGLRERDLKRKALDLGASDLLDKPVDPEDLVARLKNVLRIRQYQEELHLQNEILETRVVERTLDLEKSHQEVVLRLARAAEYRDEDTGNHVLRVSYYSQPVAKRLGFGDNERRRLFLTTALHDIGKIGVPDRVLLKAGRLDAEEWGVIRQHCVIGARILRQEHPVFRTIPRGEPSDTGQAQETHNPLLLAAADIALSHHEKWDGSGYPFGLVGEHIPFEARIVALVDVFDALTSHRPYRKALSMDEAIGMIRGDVGTHFDPRIFEAFEESMDDIFRIRSEFADDHHGGLPQAT